MSLFVKPDEGSFTYYVAHSQVEKTEFLDVYDKALEALKTNQSSIAIKDKTYTIDQHNFQDLAKYTQVFLKTHSLEEKDLQKILVNLNSIESDRNSHTILHLKKLLFLKTDLGEPDLETNQRISKLQRTSQEEIQRLQQKLNNQNQSAKRENTIKGLLLIAAPGVILGGILLALLINPALILLVPFGLILIIPGAFFESSLKENIEKTENQLKNSIENFEVLENAKMDQENYKVFLNTHNLDLANIDDRRLLELLRLFRDYKKKPVAFTDQEISLKLEKIVGFKIS